MEKEIEQLKNKPADKPYSDNIISNNKDQEEEANINNNSDNKNKDADSINEITDGIEINSNQFLSKKRVNNDINVDEEISYQEKSNNFLLFNSYNEKEIN